MLSLRVNGLIKALAQQQKELFKAQARMTELDTLFRKLYEDNARCV